MISAHEEPSKVLSSCDVNSQALERAANKCDSEKSSKLNLNANEQQYFHGHLKLTFSWCSSLQVLGGSRHLGKDRLQRKEILVFVCLHKLLRESPNLWSLH